MRRTIAVAFALALGITACQSKPAPSEEPKPAATTATATATAAPTPTPSAASSANAATAKHSGLYPVRSSNADQKALVPAEGDHVAILEGLDGTWHMVGLREGIELSHVAKVTRDMPRGGVHYDLELDEAGKKSLKDLTTAQMGKRMAFVVNDRVIVAPEVKEVIDSGRVKVSCGSGEAPCIEAMTSVYDSKSGAPATK